MRIDHLAFRVKDRQKTSKFFQEALGYKMPTEFEIEFDDGSKAKCIALKPPEKVVEDIPWVYYGYPSIANTDLEFGYPSISNTDQEIEYQMSPEIFISDGTPDSVVGKWVEARNGIGGLHHIAFQCENVAEKMREWKEKGYAEFTTEEPLVCPDLTQCFTKPSDIVGVIFEFIERGKHGFCSDNVKNLMISTKNY